MCTAPLGVLQAVVCVFISASSGGRPPLGSDVVGFNIGCACLSTDLRPAPSAKPPLLLSLLFPLRTPAADAHLSTLDTGIPLAQPFWEAARGLKADMMSKVGGFEASLVHRCVGAEATQLLLAQPSCVLLLCRYMDTLVKQSPEERVKYVTLSLNGDCRCSVRPCPQAVWRAPSRVRL